MTTQPKNAKKTLEGIVVSTKMQKTIVVKVERLKTHPIYQKKYKAVSRFHAHDASGQAHDGDLVTIEASRPISKLKRWRLKEVHKK